MRIFVATVGVLLASLGGVVAYRAAFLEPTAAIVITDASVREVSNTPRIIGGLALLIVGTALAFYAARARRS